MIEHATLVFRVFRDEKGRHVCRLDEKKQCRFLGFGHFGQVPYCLLGEANAVKEWEPMGYLKPHCGMVELIK